MSKSGKELREKALYHMNTGLVCFGLGWLKGSPCPVNPDKLTIDDIQIGHINKDDLFGEKLYRKILSIENPLDYYVPLCVLCNWRMRDLNDECLKFDRATRLAAVKYAQEHSGNEAGRKFETNGTTVRTWARDLRIELKKNKKRSIEQKKEIVKFSFDKGVSEACRRFSVSWSSIQNWRKRGL